MFTALISSDERPETFPIAGTTRASFSNKTGPPFSKWKHSGLETLRGGPPARDCAVSKGPPCALTLCLQREEQESGAGVTLPSPAQSRGGHLAAVMFAS